MSKGKIAAQCGHAVQELILKCTQKMMRVYCDNGSPKIVLQIDSDEELMEKYKEIKKLSFMYHVVMDAGKTQLKEGTRTVLGFGPIKRCEVQQIVGDVKLL